MLPLLAPSFSPILTVPVVIRASSAVVSERLPAVSVPILIGVDAVVGVRVTTPVVEVIELAVFIASESALTITYDEVAEVIFALMDTDPPLTST